MDSDMKSRPKSAPPESFYTSAKAAHFLVKLKSGQRSNAAGENEAVTFEETMNRFHTTGRMAQRMKERRRTEAEVSLIQKPTELLASEMCSRKLSHNEMENVVARVCRPTASYSARIAATRRINARDIYVPPKAMHVQYFTFENNRFKGDRIINNRDLKSLINRLSMYNPIRKPAESRTPEVIDLRKQLGPLASYRWKGLRNC